MRPTLKEDVMVFITDPKYLEGTVFSHVKPPAANGARIILLHVPKSPQGRTTRAAVAAAQQQQHQEEHMLPQPGDDTEPVLLVNFGYNQRPSNREASEYGADNGLKHAPLRSILGIAEHCPGLNMVLNVYSLGIYALNLKGKEGGGNTQYFVVYCGQRKHVDIGDHIHSPNDPNERHDESTWIAYVRAKG